MTFVTAFFGKETYMKRILIGALACLMLFAMVSCKNDTAETPENDENVIIDENGLIHDPRFDNTVEDAAACYYSLLTEDGFGNYILAFPTEFIEGYQHQSLEYDDATFEEAIRNATYTLHVNRDEKYMGYEFHIEYNHLSEEEVTGEERLALLDDLANYCYMTKSTIERVVNHTYDVVTYGYDPENDEIYYQEQENDVVTMLYITGEGWYVSPTNFELP